MTRGSGKDLMTKPRQWKGSHDQTPHKMWPDSESYTRMCNPALYRASRSGNTWDLTETIIQHINNLMVIQNLCLIV
ncbi:hypothetical protein DPMN_150617 [Dreissena polymorpha]|uniref:Uncharacterized protein n=1 Tax=Dreissena polymorpha TaxID=45954 RepID=A0A9D4FJN0_DREPO|nr:hypothetical protein DPMN_150617 [Dreissena polymorpha]